MSGAEFVELEEADAVRMAWNVWPYSRLEAAKCVVPFGVLYSPARQTRALQVVEYDPVPCKQCGGILNPYAAVDYHGKMWGCPFCHARNHFPPHYQGVSEAAVPSELWPQASTIEYVLPARAPVAPPAYVFVIDTAVAEDELAACKTAVAQALTMVPDYAQVGLVTFGTHVHVHELGFAECPKAYVFRGNKEYTPGKIQEQLGLGGGAAAAAAARRAVWPAAVPGPRRRDGVCARRLARRGRGPAARAVHLCGAVAGAAGDGAGQRHPRGPAHSLLGGIFRGPPDGGLP